MTNDDGTPVSFISSLGKSTYTMTVDFNRTTIKVHNSNEGREFEMHFPTDLLEQYMKRRVADEVRKMLAEKGLA